MFYRSFLVGMLFNFMCDFRSVSSCSGSVTYSYARDYECAYPQHEYSRGVSCVLCGGLGVNVYVCPAERDVLRVCCGGGGSRGDGCKFM